MMAVPRIMRRSTLNFINRQQWKFLFYSGVQRQYSSSIPLIYDGENDPANYFFLPSVQKLLMYLTRPTFSKVFKKRTNQGDKYLTAPEYKFMTDEELQEEIEKAREKSKQLLHMPPVVNIQKSEEKIIYKDPYITGYDDAKLVITDITFGLRKCDRMVIVREPDGTLKYSDNDVKKRIIQTYFPLTGRHLKEPTMFTDISLFNRLLELQKYEFILDRACIQYDPEEHSFQRINAQVYQHCDLNATYDLLRSTRHFGPMAFYFAWHNVIDALMLELLKNGYIKEATALVHLHRTLHPDVVKEDESKALVEEILKGKVFPEDENLKCTSSDLEIEEQCIVCIENYVNNNSTRKAQQDIALQAYRELFKQKVKVEEGIKYAHGSA